MSAAAGLDPADVARARRVGRLAGGILGAGSGLLGAVALHLLLGPDLLWLLVGDGLPGGTAYGEPLVELRSPWTLAALVAGPVLGIAGSLLGGAQLRAWGLGRAAGIAVAGAMLTSLAVHLANLALVPLVRTAAGLQEGTLSILGLLVSLLLGAVVGALAGAPAWHWMAAHIRPAR